MTDLQFQQKEALFNNAQVILAEAYQCKDLDEMEYLLKQFDKAFAVYKQAANVRFRSPVNPLIHCYD